jgi:hypothetical protein
MLGPNDIRSNPTLWFEELDAGATFGFLRCDWDRLLSKFTGSESSELSAEISGFI